jgi:hypothetical protein
MWRAAPSPTVMGVKMSLTVAGTYYPEMTAIIPVPFIGRKLRTFKSMPGQNVVVAGEKAASEALEAALGQHGLEARIQPGEGLAEALVVIERELEDSRPDAAVSVGTSEVALALAITASKLGVPLATVPGTVAGTGEADAGRILATLAALDAGSDPARAADLIASWVAEQPSAGDLD